MYLFFRLYTSLFIYIGHCLHIQLSLFAYSRLFLRIYVCFRIFHVSFRVHTSFFLQIRLFPYLHLLYIYISFCVYTSLFIYIRIILYIHVSLCIYDGLFPLFVYIRSSSIFHKTLFSIYNCLFNLFVWILSSLIYESCYTYK